MSNKVKYRCAKTVSPGDVLIDREGHEMIVIEVLNNSTGDCYALYNGEVKLVNALRSSMVVPDNTGKKNQKERDDAKT